MNEDELSTIRQIENIARGTSMISASTVRPWLNSSSVEVLGALTQHILRNSRRVEPPLSMEEICGAVEKYYKECLIQNLQTSDYAPNRSISGYEFVSWFRSLWRDSAVPREYLVRLKAMLRELCVTNKVPQEAVVTAVLEHLFETPEIADFFGDWRSDPQLANAFSLAKEWDSKP